MEIMGRQKQIGHSLDFASQYKIERAKVIASESQGLEKQRRLVLGWILLAGGIAVKIPGLFSDLWLDEIWGIVLAENLSTPLDIFTSIHFDTNHWLYSFYLYCLGEQQEFWLYRLPSIIAGGITPWLFVRYRQQDDFFENLIIAFLFLLSFPLIVYSSEARGYALVILFTVLAILLYEQELKNGQLGRQSCMAAIFILGFLSHITFLMPFIALTSSVIFTSWKSSLKVKIQKYWPYFTASIFLIWLYLVDIRYVRHGGADTSTLPEMLMSAGALFCGLITPSHLVQLFCFGAALMLSCVGIYIMHRRKQPWLHYFLGIFVAPVIVLTAASYTTDFDSWVERHLLVILPFIFVLAGIVIAKALLNPYPVRLLGIILLILYVLINCSSIVDFFVFGRGEYSSALVYISNTSIDKEITIASDHDFRNAVLIDFYKQRLPSDHNFRYIDQTDIETNDVDWFIVHRQRYQKRPGKIIRVGRRKHFRFDKAFFSSGISGWDWFVYQSTDLNSGTK